MSFSLLAAVLLASVIEQPDSQKTVEKIDELVDEPDLVQQVEQPILPAVVQLEPVLPIVVPESKIEEVLDVIPNDDIEVKKINEIVNDNPEEDNLTHLSASASDEADLQSDNDQEVEDENVTENADLTLNSESSEDENGPQVFSLETEDESEIAEPTSQLVQRKPASSPLVSSASSSIEEVDVRRPQVPQDIRIWPILIDIFQTPFVMELMTWSAMILFVAILFHHMFTNY